MCWNFVSRPYCFRQWRHIVATFDNSSNKTFRLAINNKSKDDQKNFLIAVKNFSINISKICTVTDFIRYDFICTRILTCVTHHNWWSFVRESKFKSKWTFCCLNETQKLRSINRERKWSISFFHSITILIYLSTIAFSFSFFISYSFSIVYRIP